jgi:integrase
MLATLPEGLLGTRDRALLLIGFAGAFRRSELVGLNVEDASFTGDGLVVTLPRSKTDQEGEGRKVGIPYGSNPATCPVRSLRAWIETAGITAGPLFRSVNRYGRVQPGRLSDKAVALIVKRYAQASGRDARTFSGHSLRVGLVTAAAMAGASERAIMNQTGHRSTVMVRRYIRDASLFRDNAAARAGL